ncbi:hypothetical protein B9N60_06480 [Campylobacter concisus]|uniref:Uncharacterized protein n=1 Tax=Campylobacter concisus TaxID=199 RepID=A0A1Y5N8G8_9BACT|nr:hypothetical protein B9N60_06480 [Campylobacter concisus]
MRSLKFRLFRLVFFYLYFVGFKFCSVITHSVTPVTKFKTASSKRKILHLNLLNLTLRGIIFALCLLVTASRSLVLG